MLTPLRRMRAPLSVLLVALACLGLAATAPLQRLALPCLDLGWRLLRQLPPAPALDRAAGPGSVQTDVVIVGLDEASIADSGKPFALMQGELAELLAGLSAGEARAVGFDLVLPARSYPALLPSATHELALALAQTRARMPLVIGAMPVLPTADEDAARLYAAVVGDAGLASLQVPPDADGVLRRAPVVHALPAQWLPPLGTQLAGALGVAGRDGWVDFRLGAPFVYLPLARMLALARAGDQAGLRALLKGRVVLVGAILPDQDRQRLPVALAAWEHGVTTAGVVFQAQLLRSQLAQRMVQPAPLAEAAAAVLAAWLMWRLRRRPRTASAAALALAVSAAALALLGLYHGRLASPLAAWLVLATGVAWCWWRAYRDQRAGQRRMRSIFAGYVSPAILDTILSGDLRAGLASQRQPLAFLFADLRGFTGLCAVMPPEQVIAMLNRYYAAITVPLHRHGGTIDKFSGDGVMVFFGAPAPSDNPCRDALLAAHGVLEALALLNAELAREGQAPLQAGIGIAYGDAVLGNVGSAERHDYTATGAATALAAHIQQLCKSTTYCVLVERSVLERAALPPALLARYALFERHLDKHGPVALAGYPVLKGTDYVHQMDAGSLAAGDSVAGSGGPPAGD